MSHQSNIDTLRKTFEDSWEPMIELMGRARQVEFKIRLTAEILTNGEIIFAKSFDEFMKGPRKSQRKKMEKHIRDIFGSEREQLILIRQCSDNLAHADYISARTRIKQYQKQFGLNSELNESNCGIVSFRNVLEPDGPNGIDSADIAYVIGSSEENLILEEFQVFQHQGYKKAAEEMIEFAEKSIDNLVPNFQVRYASLVMSRGLKYGKRINKIA